MTFPALPPEGDKSWYDHYTALHNRVVNELQPRSVSYLDLPTTGLISAHRGSSRVHRPVAPEGSMSAYRLAVSYGCSIIDLDNYTTSDNIPMVIHDPTVDASTASTGNAADYPAHAFPDIYMPEYTPGWPPERTPSVEEVMSEFGSRVCITVEPKDGIAGIQPMGEIIERLGLRNSVFLNTSLPAVAQAITDAGFLCHFYGATDIAGIDAAMAAGAKLLELPYNASTALVDYAVASGVHRFIAAPIRGYAELEAMDPRFNGFVSDSVGYLGRPGGKTQRSAKSLGPSIALGRRGPGWKIERGLGMSYVDWITPGVGVNVRKNADWAYFMFGDLSGTPATSGSITITVRVPVLPTDLTQRVGARLFAPEEDGNGLDTNTKGYVVSLRANGQLNMWSSPVGAYGGGTALGATPTGTALVAGTDYQILFEWSQTQVRATRVDTGGTTGWVNETNWRSPFIYSVISFSNGEAQIRDIVWN